METVLLAAELGVTPRLLEVWLKYEMPPRSQP